MPYIHVDDRARAAEEPTGAGELNYAITLKAIEYITNPELAATDFHKEASELAFGYLDRVSLNYTSGNTVMGVLDCVGREMERRLSDNPEADQLVTNVKTQLKILRDYIYNSVLGPYEGHKITENGDVYPEEIL